MNGLKGIFKSLTLFSDFPWGGKVLFEGKLYEQHHLPLNYLPKLLTIQFSEPLIILAAVGFVLSGYLVYKRKIDILKIMLLYFWLCLPILYLMIVSPTIYHNFRQLLFITPPIFIFAGFSLEKLAIILKSSKLVFALTLIMIIPSLYSIIHLHPYQYVYYNAFVGGVKGAGGSYLMDYWGTAYKEAVDYLNENAPDGSKILIWKDNVRGERYASKRFIFRGHTDVPEEDFKDFNFAIVVTNEYRSVGNLAEYPVIYEVSVDNVALLSILQISNKQ